MADRDLTSGMVTEVTAERLDPILLAHFAFDSGDVRMWTGVGTLTWDSETWLGGGDLIGVDPAEETADLAAAGASFTLSGVPSSLIATALAEDYQERPATMWLACLDGTGAVVADPYALLAARMDVMVIDEGPDTSAITIRVENRLIDLEVARERHYTSADQQEAFAGDTLFDMVPALQDAEIIWKAAA